MATVRLYDKDYNDMQMDFIFRNYNVIKASDEYIVVDAPSHVIGKLKQSAHKTNEEFSKNFPSFFEEFLMMYNSVIKVGDEGLTIERLKELFNYENS